MRAKVESRLLSVTAELHSCFTIFWVHQTFERARTGEWWALGDDLRTFEPQSGQPCLTSGIMAGTGGDGRVCKSLSPGAPGRTTKTAIGGQRV